jgi:hypothetical protein
MAAGKTFAGNFRRDMGRLTDPMKSLFVELSAKVSILLISAAMLLMKLLTNGSSVSGAKTR